MKTTLLLLFISAITATQNAAAQTAAADSAQTIDAARLDAHRFRLSNENFNKFLREHFPATSDYFKPSYKANPNLVLLNDSLYVRSYRTAAYYRVLDRKTPHTPHDVATLKNAGPGGFSAAAYTTTSQQTAQNDAGQFSLTPDMLKKFKKAPFPATSDYFTPTTAIASNPALLTDSAYVKTFRFEAFYKTYHQRAHPVTHGLLIGGLIAAGVVLVVGIVAIAIVLTTID